MYYMKQQWHYSDGCFMPEVSSLKGSSSVAAAYRLESLKDLMLQSLANLYQPQHNKTSKMAWVPSEDSDQPGHPSSLIRVFTVRMKKAWVLNYPLSAQRRLWSDLADAQADLCLRWAHSHFVSFVMSRLILNNDLKLSVWPKSLDTPVLWVWNYKLSGEELT